jgi:hypothetical protein
MRCGRPCAALGPSACDLVPLANARFIGEPGFYSGLFDALSRAISLRRVGSFFYVLQWRHRPEHDAWDARRACDIQDSQFPAQGLFENDELELFEKPLAEIHDTPTNDAMNSQNGSALDNGGKRLAACVVEP